MKAAARGVAVAAGLLAVLGTVAWAFGPLGGAGALLASLLGLGASELFAAHRLRPQAAAQRARPGLPRSFALGLLLPLGLAMLFVAERVVGEGAEHVTAWRVLAGAALALAFAWRAYRAFASRGAVRRVELRLALATAGVGLALGLYALSTEAASEGMGLAEEAAARAQGAFGALWVAALVVSLAALAFMEVAARAMPIEEAVELRRIDAAGAQGLTLAFALVFACSASYVAHERDVKRDLSYLRTTRPSETTLRRVRALDEPVRAVLFYPRVHEVLERLRPYFAELDAASEAFSVQAVDHALEPELARRHRVRGNGFVLLLRGQGEGQQGESFEIGTTLDVARSRLRTLDGRFQEHFAQLTVRPRELYVTSGHQERTASGAEGDPPEQRLGEFEEALQRGNIASRELGIAQGLASQVPEGAPAVAVVGPRAPFLPEEAASLARYVERGGRVLVLLDPDSAHGLEPLLRRLGVELRAGVLHNERDHLRRSDPLADRALVYSNNYSAHPTVTLATRYRRAPAIFDRAGALARAEQGQREGVQVTFPLWAGARSWLDLDADHEQDAGEPSAERFHPMAAVTVPNESGREGRVVVIADGDFMTDALIRNAGNAFVVMDTLNWLVGESEVFGPTQTEEDVPIEHTREQDKVWFYATSFALPLPLLVLGAWLARRRYAGSRKPEPRAATEAYLGEPWGLALQPRGLDPHRADPHGAELGGAELGGGDAGEAPHASETEQRR